MWVDVGDVGYILYTEHFDVYKYAMLSIVEKQL